MSHFSVAVFTNGEATIKELLAPYDENLAVEEEQDENGEKYSYNPNAKWDWYEVGGRWMGMLIPKKDFDGGEHGVAGVFGNGDYYECGCDAIPVEEIDFEEMEKRERQELVPFNECYERKVYKKEYFDSIYPDEETYIKMKTKFSTYAAVTPDGEWHAAGEMGWFGVSSETSNERHEFVDNYWKEFIEPALKNGWKLTIVDCHI